MSSYDCDDGYNSKSCEYLLDVSSAFDDDFNFSPPHSQTLILPADTYVSTLESLLDANTSVLPNPHSSFNRLGDVSRGWPTLADDWPMHTDEE
ncbi:hypothetical protein F5141DRAFT_1222086 [Pisolithus sp. B1]|nr:hypothetical protein F5141DRAFT_1222086 [Pisolithus sp. B1]